MPLPCRLWCFHVRPFSTENRGKEQGQSYQLFDGGHASFPFTKNACQLLFATDAIGIHHFPGFFLLDAHYLHGFFRASCATAGL
jgi:hypothetical protein